MHWGLGQTVVSWKEWALNWVLLNLSFVSFWIFSFSMGSLFFWAARSNAFQIFETDFPVCVHILPMFDICHAYCVSSSLPDDSPFTVTPVKGFFFEKNKKIIVPMLAETLLKITKKWPRNTSTMTVSCIKESSFNWAVLNGKTLRNLSTDSQPSMTTVKCFCHLSSQPSAKKCQFLPSWPGSPDFLTYIWWWHNKRGALACEKVQWTQIDVSTVKFSWSWSYINWLATWLPGGGPLATFKL